MSEYFNVEKVDNKTDKINLIEGKVKSIFDLNDKELAKFGEELEKNISQKISDLNKNLESNLDNKDTEISKISSDISKKLDEYRNDESITKDKLLLDISAIIDKNGGGGSLFSKIKNFNPIKNTIEYLGNTNLVQNQKTLGHIDDKLKNSL